jgi:hypothetical protein
VARLGGLTALWIVVALFWLTIDPAHVRSEHGDIAAALLAQYAIVGSGLVVIIPLAARLTRFYARRFETPRARALAHAGSAVGATIAHLAASAVLSQALLPDTAVIPRLIFSGWTVWDIGIYLITVVVVQGRELARWYRDAIIEIGHTRAELARARVQALRLRLQPALMIHALDAIAALASRDPRQCEWLIRRVGQLLRWLLANASREWVSVADEIELLNGYLDVEGIRTHGLQRRIDVDGSLLGMSVPPVLFQPLVAQLLRERPSTTSVSVWLDGELDDDGMVFRVGVGEDGTDARTRSSLAGYESPSATGDDASVVPELIARLHELYRGAHRVRRVHDRERTEIIVRVPLPSEGRAGDRAISTWNDTELDESPVLGAPHS